VPPQGTPTARRFPYEAPKHTHTHTTPNERIYRPFLCCGWGQNPGTPYRTAPRVYQHHTQGLRWVQDGTPFPRGGRVMLANDNSPPPHHGKRPQSSRSIHSGPRSAVTTPPPHGTYPRRQRQPQRLGRGVRLPAAWWRSAGVGAAGRGMR